MRDIETASASETLSGTKSTNAILSLSASSTATGTETGDRTYSFSDSISSSLTSNSFMNGSATPSTRIASESSSISLTRSLQSSLDLQSTVTGSPSTRMATKSNSATNQRESRTSEPYPFDSPSSSKLSPSRMPPSESETASSSPSNCLPNYLMEIPLNNLTASLLIDLPPINGSMIGSLYISPEISSRPNGVLMIQPRCRPSTQKSIVISEVLDITLGYPQGIYLTQLDHSLTICFPRPLNTKKSDKLCLGYFDEDKSKWKCEDKCLTVPGKGSSGGDHVVCGETGHLTNFALLLDLSEEGEPCQSDNFILASIATGLVGGAVLVVAFSVLLLEVYFRHKQNRLSRHIRKIMENNEHEL